MASMEEKLEYYSILGVDRAASPVEIRAAYKKLALQLHPDKNKEDSEATKKFQNLAEAYMVLKDPEKRSRYDNGTLNDDVYFDGEDAFEQFGGNPHTFHDFFGFLFARMFARRGTQGAGANGNQAFFWDPDEEDAEFDSEEEEYISEEEEEDDGEYYDADPSWRHGGEHADGHRHQVNASAGGTGIPSDIVPPDQLKRPKVTLQKSDLIISWGYNKTARKPVDLFILEMKKDMPPGHAAQDHPLAQWQAIYTGHKQSVKVSGLDPGCAFRFRVKAANAAGASMPSAETCITTPKGPSNPPGFGNTASSSNANNTASNTSSTGHGAGQAKSNASDQTSKRTGSTNSGNNHDGSGDSNAAPSQPKNKGDGGAAKKLPAGSAKQNVDKSAKSQKLLTELEAAMQKRSKTQIEQILATAKKQGISLPQHTVDSAHQLISELNAVADQNRQINLVRQKLIQATTNRSLDEIQALLKEVNHLGAAKRLQAQIVDAQKVLDSLQKDLSIQQKMDQAIRAKDVPALENAINAARTAGLPIKEAKKALRGIVLGQELLQKIENAMQEKDQATMIDILAYTKEKPPRDAEVAKLLDVCRQRVASSLKAGFESALKKKDYTTAKQVLKQSSDVGFDLAGSSATFRSQMELLEVEDIRAELKTAIHSTTPDRATGIHNAINRAVNSPYSSKLQIDIDNGHLELEKLAIEESVRFQLREALTLSNKEKLLGAIQAAIGYPSLQKDVAACQNELDRILDAEERALQRKKHGAPSVPVSVPPSAAAPSKAPAAPTPVPVPVVGGARKTSAVKQPMVVGSQKVIPHKPANNPQVAASSALSASPPSDLEDDSFSKMQEEVERERLRLRNETVGKATTPSTSQSKAHMPGSSKVAGSAKVAPVSILQRPHDKNIPLVSSSPGDPLYVPPKSASVSGASAKPDQVPPTTKFPGVPPSQITQEIPAMATTPMDSIYKPFGAMSVDQPAPSSSQYSPFASYGTPGAFGMDSLLSGGWPGQPVSTSGSQPLPTDPTTSIGGSLYSPFGVGLGIDSLQQQPYPMGLGGPVPQLGGGGVYSMFDNSSPSPLGTWQASLQTAASTSSNHVQQTGPQPTRLPYQQQQQQGQPSQVHASGSAVNSASSDSAWGSAGLWGPVPHAPTGGNGSNFLYPDFSGGLFRGAFSPSPSNPNGGKSGNGNNNTLHGPL